MLTDCGKLSILLTLTSSFEHNSCTSSWSNCHKKEGRSELHALAAQVQRRPTFIILCLLIREETVYNAVVDRITESPHPTFAQPATLIYVLETALHHTTLKI
jgi:hypothetical protein